MTGHRSAMRAVRAQAVRGVLGGALLGAGLLAAGCGAEPGGEVRAPAAPAAGRLRVEAAVVATVAEGGEAVGTVRSRTQVVVASKLQGYVREVRAREGDRVEPGRLLVLVDDREPRARLERARATLEEATLALEEAERAAQEARTAVRSAEAEARYAEATADRYRELRRQELISPQDHEATEARRHVTAAALDGTRSHVRMAVARERMAGQRIAQARADLESAELTLGDTRIVAPGDGVVVERRVEPGGLAVPGQPLLVLDDPRSYRLEAAVAESAAGRLRLGDVLPVTIDALGRTVPGRVVELVPAADPATRTVIVKLELPAGLTLRSGLFGRAALPGAERPAILVPATAVVPRGQLEHVFVVDAGARATLRLVTTGRRRGERVEVLSGLAAGERVVVEPPAGLADGARVEPAS